LYYDKEDFTHKINPNHLLIEVAWEVCNQVGGIYTVIRSKAPAMTRNHSGHYCMIGPYLNKNILAELEPLEDTADVFGLPLQICASGVMKLFMPIG
jgi:glycogen(starch) synthase